MPTVDKVDFNVKIVISLITYNWFTALKTVNVNLIFVLKDGKLNKNQENENSDDDQLRNDNTFQNSIRYQIQRVCKAILLER